MVLFGIITTILGGLLTLSEIHHRKYERELVNKLLESRGLGPIDTAEPYVPPEVEQVLPPEKLRFKVI